MVLLALSPVSSLAENAGEDTLHVLFTGDVLLDRGVRRRIQVVGVDRLMSGVDSLFHCNDAVMINLECPLSSEVHPVSKQIVFRADTALASALRRHGVTHAALANNHSVDQGFKGLEETHDCLTRNGICVAGYGVDCGSRIAPVIIEKGGVRIAVFNDCPLPLENWPRSSADRANIESISVDSLCAEMRRFHLDNPDCRMVAFLHWGTEYYTSPNITQQMDAVKLVSAGAVAIIGHHPHVIQPMRRIGSVPVFFSIGNFVFDQKRPGTDHGLAVELLFNSQGLVGTRQHDIKITNCRPAVIGQ